MGSLGGEKLGKCVKEVCASEQKVRSWRVGPRGTHARCPVCAYLGSLGRLVTTPRETKR